MLVSQFAPEKVLRQVKDAHQAGKKVVLVTGVFDLLHQEHINFLRKAKAAGDLLIVAIESDVRVRQIKGEGRPIDPQDKRQAKLEELKVADAVFILPEEFSKQEHYRGIVAELRPEYLAVSAHSEHLENKQKILSEFGGEVLIVHEHNPAISTTQLLAQAEEK